MAYSTHQQTLIDAINLLDIEIDQQRKLVEALVQAKGVLELYQSDLNGSTETGVVYVDRGQVEKMLGVSRSSIDRYRVGDVPRGRGPFPKPVNKRGHAQLWDREEVLLWKRTLDGTQ